MREVPAALRRPELAKCWTAIRRRLETNGGAITASPLRIDDATPAERDAIAGLLGTPRVAAGPIRVRVDHLDRALRSSAAGMGLVDVLTTLSGPLRDRRAERADNQAEKDGYWASARRHPLLNRWIEVGDWLDQARRSGVAARAAGDLSLGEVLRAVLDVLDRLPADGLPLARLAAEVTGDAHGLDRGRAVGSLTVNALSYLSDVPVPGSAASWRRLWESFGVVCDDLSCDVLVLNVRPLGSSLLARVARDHADAGEPLRVTLRQLVRSAGAVFGDECVSVCENPVVVAHVADTLGSGSAPLVCVDGIPNTAARRLLATITQSGAALRYHGDFDWGGLRIANIMVDQLGAIPWRMSVDDYRGALERAARPGVALGPRRVRAAWALELTDVMAREGIAIHEEQVLDDLTRDLTTPRSGPAELAE